jgi:hypothetical protein
MCQALINLQHLIYLPSASFLQYLHMTLLPMVVAEFGHLPPFLLLLGTLVQGTIIPALLPATQNWKENGQDRS